MIFAIVAALGVGIYIGAHISFRRSVDREVTRRIEGGPLSGLSAKALQIQRSMSALRGRAFAASILYRRIKELEPNEAVISLELVSLMVTITSNKSPVEDLDASELPTLEECKFQGTVGRKTIEEMDAINAAMLEHDK